MSEHIPGYTDMDTTSLSKISETGSKEYYIYQYLILILCYILLIL